MSTGSRPPIFPLVAWTAVVGGILGIALPLLWTSVGELIGDLRLARDWEQNSTIVEARVKSAEYLPLKRRRVGSSGDCYALTYEFRDRQGALHEGQGCLDSDTYHQALQRSSAAADRPPADQHRSTRNGESAVVRVQVKNENPETNRLESESTGLAHNGSKVLFLLAFFLPILALPGKPLIKRLAAHWYYFGAQPMQVQVDDIESDSRGHHLGYFVSVRYRDCEGRRWRTLRVGERRNTLRARLAGTIFLAQARLKERSVGPGMPMMIWVSQINSAVYYLNHQAVLAVPDH